MSDHLNSPTIGQPASDGSVPAEMPSEGTPLVDDAVSSELEPLDDVEAAAVPADALGVDETAPDGEELVEDLRPESDGSASMSEAPGVEHQAAESDADEPAPAATTPGLDALGTPVPEAPTADDAAALAGDAPVEVDAGEGADLVAEAEMTDAPVVDDPWKRKGKWYVVHTQSGYEKKAKSNLEARISSMNMEERIHEVVIPLEDVVEFKNGKKVVVQKKMFPGYVLVRCELDDDAWYVIRDTPNITGFVGQGAKPTPLPRREVRKFLQIQTPEAIEAQTKRSKPRLEYELNETVRVKEGPFADFSGEIIEINEDQLKVKVLVNIFGRETPVELEFAQVAKL